LSDLALVRFYQLVLSEELVLDDATYKRMETEALEKDIQAAVVKAVQEEIDRQLFAQSGAPVRIAETPERPWLAIKVPTA
jgi:hypothetical protein